MRKFLIVASEKDLASMNIANNIMNANNFIEIESFEKVIDRILEPFLLAI